MFIKKVNVLLHLDLSTLFYLGLIIIDWLAELNRYRFLAKASQFLHFFCFFKCLSDIFVLSLACEVDQNLQVSGEVVIHDVGWIESVPSVIEEHFWFENSFSNESLYFLDFLDVSIVPDIKSVIVVVEIIWIVRTDLLGPLIILISFS